MTDRRDITPLDRSAAAVADVVPWYLNETLDDADRGWVDATLANDPAAREALAFDRQIAAVLAQRVDEVPADIGWNQLLRQVRADTAAATVAGFDDAPGEASGAAVAAHSKATASTPAAAGVSVTGRMGEWLAGFLTPNVAVGVAALLIAQTVAIGLLLDRPGAEVEYRSVGTLRPVPVIRAIMNDSTPEKLLRESLQDQGLSIVAGPDTLGQYLLAADGETDLSAAAQVLHDAGVIASFSLDRQVMDR